jgi:hypothetical protein
MIVPTVAMLYLVSDDFVMPLWQPTLTNTLRSSASLIERILVSGNLTYHLFCISIDIVQATPDLQALKRT